MILSSLLWILFTLPSCMLCLERRPLPTDSDTTSRQHNIQRKKENVSNSVSFLRVYETFFNPQNSLLHITLARIGDISTSKLIPAKGSGMNRIGLQANQDTPTGAWDRVSFPPILPQNKWGRGTFLNKLGNSLGRNKDDSKSQVGYTRFTSPACCVFSRCPCVFLSSPCSVSPVARLCPTLGNPMGCSKPGFCVHRQLPGFTQAHVHQVGDTFQSSHPLTSPSPPTFNLSQHQGLFQWVSS